ncbi:MAG: TonB family protein [Thermoanaerobaculaceae bacterium]|nr:TonB family protein [Thermoanaerobaculaceae bacterium]MDI9621392.1 TonB family protein [Acidobacteriota bacterium]NLH10997.1 TonB family protein [Holophagae bacterium]HPW55433.1 TonB family protein [Thermoanaerobaculaceae bacterium]
MPDPHSSSLHLLLHALVWNSIFAALAAALLTSALKLARVRWPAAWEAAWWLVLLRLVLPPSLSSPFSARTLVASAWAWLAHRAPEARAAAPVDVSVTFSPATTASSASGIPWAIVVFGLWASGATLTALCIGWRVWRHRRIAASSTTVSDPAIVAACERWRLGLGVRRPVVIATSDRCLSPFAAGLARPRIFLPESVVAWPTERVEPVIAHEMAHLARWDEARILLAGVVTSLFFFNPLVWIALRQLAASREQACDERVLQMRAFPASRYVESLLAVLRLPVLGPVSERALLGLASGKELIKMRLVTILGHPARRPHLVFLVTFVVGVGAFLLPMGRAVTAGPTPAPSPTAVPVTAAMQPPATPVASPLPTEIDGEPIVMIGGSVQPPVPIIQSPPVYPVEARTARVSGVVILKTIIDTAGVVRDVEILRGLPMGISEAAVETVKQWRYEPATLDGRPVPVYLNVTVRFALHEDPPGQLSIHHLQNERWLLQMDQAIWRAVFRALVGLSVSSPELTFEDQTIQDNRFRLVATTDSMDRVDGYLARLERSRVFRSVTLRSSEPVDGRFRIVLEADLDPEAIPTPPPSP